ncbi:MAG: radical SAM protein [Desulfobacterales bacterium]|nr:radical SAM protein [Desulfobacterales bacterium]MDD4072362.1 radical SAM protein [Desulfobacterales bacterium]MDD4393034.1 radical SAM protein [Desulfobacterales bacterium]
MSLRVNEIFYSIQGESLFSGRPCVFVRLTGCNLRCTYCDTRYAYSEGIFMSIPQILDQVATCRCKLVEITGGEPLLQEDTPDLVRQLLALNYKVLMETNGSHDISRVDRRCVHIVDIKCPASGECHHNDLANLKRIGPEDQLKFVIRDQEDYRFARETLVSVPAGFPTDHALFSPVAGKLEPAVLAGWILEDHLDVRLHLQLHNFIWPDIDRGV